jgi:uncharacterized RDD family membrane protein YckC
MSNDRDPRQTITHDAFSVAPELLGLPLAHPWRRATAILIDLAIIGLLANARGVLLALAAGAFLFWLAFRGRRAGLGSKLARATIGCTGATVVFVGVLVVWFTMFVDEDAVLFETEEQSGGVVPVTLGTAADILRLVGSADSAEAEEAATRLVERLGDQGISRNQMEAVLTEASQEADAPIVRAIERAIEQVEPEREDSDLPVDSLLAAYQAARASGDTASESRVAELLGRRLTSEDREARERQIVRLESTNESLRSQVQRIEEELEEERNRGFLSTILGFFDELGLGIGWSGLYFTFLTAFFRGQTPGKRLLGVRVLRLDGHPITYWVAFERFGGYAASLFTGMEGFVRILWDRNRQTLEDKLAETVVIRDTKAARARLAIAAAERGVADQEWKGGVVPGAG